MLFKYHLNMLLVLHSIFLKSQQFFKVYNIIFVKIELQIIEHQVLLNLKEQSTFKEFKKS